MLLPGLTDVIVNYRLMLLPMYYYWLMLLPLANNKDDRQGRKDRTVPGLASRNNENRDGTVSNINNRWVVNLSGQSLTEAEYKVLTHGPNFAVTSRSPHGRMHHRY